MRRKREIAIAVIFSGAVAVSASACSDSGVCDPGRLRMCTCGPSTTGIQSCLANGSGYEPCRCSTPDATTDPDADMPDVPPEEGEGSDAADGTDNMWLLQNCLVGGNVTYLSGDEDDYIHPGVESFTDSWTFVGFADRIHPPNETVDTVFVRMLYDRTIWQLYFSTHALESAIDVGYYPSAMYYPREDEGHPGLLIAGEGRDCLTLYGWFEIHEVEVDDTVTPPSLLRLTATFEQHCEEDRPRLLGCIHFE